MSDCDDCDKFVMIVKSDDSDKTTTRTADESDDLCLDWSGQNLSAEDVERRFWGYGQSLLRVRELDLHANRLTALPSTVLSLRRLQRLYLDHNTLSALPESFGNDVSVLTDLALHENQLTDLPPSIGRLRKLETLRLDRNRLTSIPTELCDCCALRTLHIDGNDVRSLPQSIGRLRHLADFGIGSNPHLRRIPPSLADAEELMVVWFDDATMSAIENVPQTVLRSGDADVLRRFLCSSASSDPAS